MNVRPFRLLLVQDDPGYAPLLARLLEGARGRACQVTVAATVAAACDHLRSGAIDLVLLDLAVNGGGGLEALRTILVASPETPVVVLTDRAEGARAREALRQGAQDYLEKQALDEGSMQGGALFRAISYAAQRKLAERRLGDLEAQLLQARVETLGRVARGMGQELHELHGAILAACDRLASGEEEGRLAEIREAASRAASLTSELLSFAPEANLDLHVQDVGAAVLAARELLAGILGPRIRLDLMVSPVQAKVVVPRGLVERLCTNLALNAREAMPDGGWLQVEVSREGEGQARLSFRDCGEGMAPEVRRRCFEPFFTTRAKAPSAGLGLTAVYCMVRHAGGSVDVESDLGVGTTVHLLLPLARDARAAAVAAPDGQDAEPMGNRGTVLLVEDESTIRKLLTRILTRRGFRVVDVDTAEEALELALQERPDVLLTDIVLPGIWGYELTSRLREVYPDLPVVQMSGYLGEDRAQEPGVLFLPKPFSEPEMTAKVREALSYRPAPPLRDLPQAASGTEVPRP